MKKFTLKQLLIGIVAMLLMTPSISKANPLPWVVEFVVLNQKQQPINDAVITLGSVTNPPGDYFFGLDLPGTYDYVVAREGYQNAVGVVHIIENQYEPIVEEVTLIIECGFIIHDASSLAGEDILVDTEIINTGFEFVSFQVDIILPEGFGYVQGSAFLNPERKADHIVNASILPGTNTLRMIAFTLTNAAFIGESGIIASFTLTTPEVPGNYQLLIESFIGVPCPNPINLPGTVILTPPAALPGDSNCDGEVNVLDVITTANYILGNNPQPFCFENADVNGDGVINVIDVTGTINIILSGGFVCGTSTVTDIDGNIYNTVQIGNQCWMKENLKTTKYRNGTPIEYPGDDNAAWQNNTTGAYAWYNNDISWKESYRAMYNWHAVNNINGLCPAGWHVPSDAEWTQLVDYVVAQGFPNQLDNLNGAGNALKSCRQVNSPLGGDCNTTVHPRWIEHDWYPYHHGFDEFGFSGLPGGVRDTNGNFFSLGAYGQWWSSTESSSTSAWLTSMFHIYGDVYRNHFDKS